MPPPRGHTLLSRLSLHLMASDNHSFLPRVPHFPEAPALQPSPGTTGGENTPSSSAHAAARTAGGAVRPDARVSRKRQPPPGCGTERSGHEGTGREDTRPERLARRINRTII